MTMLPVCNACRDGQDFPTAITMAFQPIVDVSTRSIYAGEALVRGINGESAGSILAAVDERNRYAFDQACRIKAIECAAQIALPTLLSINFMPNAVYNPEHCLRATLSATEQSGSAQAGPRPDPWHRYRPKPPSHRSPRHPHVRRTRHRRHCRRHRIPRRIPHPARHGDPSAARLSIRQTADRRAAEGALAGVSARMCVCT